MTSTLAVFETFTPGRPEPPGRDVPVPELKQMFELGFDPVKLIDSVKGLVGLW